MKKITFNVYRLDKAKHRAYMNEHPDAHWYQQPTDVYDIVELEGYLISARDLVKEGFPADKAQELDEKDIKFVVHHGFESYGEGISKWWTCSEYSTSAKMTRHNREKRYISITDLCVELDRRWHDLETALAKHQQEAGIINQ